MKNKKMPSLLVLSIAIITTSCIALPDPVNSKPLRLIDLQLATPSPAYQDTSYLSTLEKDVITELNKVRTDPKGYAENQVTKYRALYQGNLIVRPGEISMSTNEGVSAVDECYKVLMATSPMGTLTPSKGMSKASQDLVSSQSGTNDIGHNASDGSDPFTRMERYGRYSGNAAENVDYGYNDAEKIVLALLVDDGVSSRGHRANILDDRLHYIGVAAGTHKLYRYMFVMDFAGGYTEK